MKVSLNQLAAAADARTRKAAHFGGPPPYVGGCHESGSVLIIVLWIALGLIVVTIYFADSTSLELRAADNRIAGLAADEAIEGAARYVSYVLTTFATNGAVPDVAWYQAQAVPVGSAHFWIIGRAGDNIGQPDQLYFSLVDEGSKLNLNTISAGRLENLTNMTAQLAANIRDWRDADGNVSENGDGATVYARLNPPYAPKYAPYETVDELRLIYGMDTATLYGEDLNRNGVLDANEVDQNRNGVGDLGLVDYATVYSREPNVRADGTARVNVNSRTAVTSLLTDNFGQTRGAEIVANIQPNATGAWPNFNSTLQFYNLAARTTRAMTLEEFAQIEDAISTSNAATLTGRINVNTASAAVLACVPGIGPERAADVVAYRQSNPDRLGSIAWVREALNSNNAINQAGQFLTTRSYQFTADIAALGPHGRGYRRTLFVFDVSEGAPKIIYRRDLSHLGWALGKPVRQTWLASQQKS